MRSLHLAALFDAAIDSSKAYERHIPVTFFVLHFQHPGEQVIFREMAAQSRDNVFGRGALGMSHAARIGQLRPLAWAAIAALSGTVLLTAGVFAARPKSERPGGIAPAAETQQVETSEIPPRPVHTVLVGAPESADPASTE